VPRSREPDRERTRELLADALAAGTPLAWFETLYAESDDLEDVPWADLEPNPNLVTLPEVQAGGGRRALVVGCGFGDDAEWLAAHGWATTAFDIAPSAVRRARDRWPESTVDYAVADVTALPPSYAGRLDLIVEIYTLQVLPGDLRERAFESLRAALAPGGLLVVICRGRDENAEQPVFPWPLTEPELRAGLAGLELDRFEDYPDASSDDPPVRRFRVLARRTP
jgi:SAM-dependent methyltransferase